MSKLGDRLKELSDKHGYGKPAPDAYSAIAEAFANEVRHDAIPWAHRALDDVGAPKGPDIAGRVRALKNEVGAWREWSEVLDRTKEKHRERVQELERQRDAAPARLTENALNACKEFDAPTDPSDAVVHLATLLDERDAVREELRAIIVEAIKGGGEGK